MIVVPPGWDIVSRSTNPLDKVQVICKDSKGRLQYIYHPVWTAIQKELKFYKLNDLVKRMRCIPRNPPMSDTEVWLIKLMLYTNIRIGSECYAKDNNSYGITTILPKHVTFEKGGKTCTLRFKGKSGVPWNCEITNGGLVNFIRHKYDNVTKRRDPLFSPATAGTVRRVFKGLLGRDATPKNLRTYKANEKLFDCLTKEQRKLDSGDVSESVLKGAYNRSIQKVAVAMNHTTAVCKKEYINPDIISLWIKSPQRFNGSFRAFIASIIS